MNRSEVCEVSVPTRIHTSFYSEVDASQIKVDSSGKESNLLSRLPVIAKINTDETVPIDRRC